jgi:signal transduction histidine kinase/ActR/RegA family two-component response regulator
MGWGWRAAIHPGDVDRCVEAWNRSMDSGVPYQAEVRVRRADGAYRWHLARAFAQRSADGAILRWFGTATDIDDARRDKELAEAASRMKDEFLATLSHELRTPLHAILSWASLLRRVGGDATKREHAADVIERSARAQTTLVEDLLDASRIVSGKLRLQVQRVDLPSVLRAAADVVKPAADAKGLEMRIDIAPEVGTMVGDPGRLQQVAWNLLINAVKFTKSGGRIVLRARPAGSSIAIEVSDTGIGITQEHLPFLFERFHQVDSSTTRTYAGLGLGLAIVRHLVEAHGGTVAARSAGPGLGATFTVTLPIHAAVAPEAAAMESEAKVESGTQSATRLREAHERAQPGVSPLHGVRALVVEDDPDSLELLQTMLQLAGAGVTTAMSAPEALEAASGATFDVVISDIGMPEMNGYAFMKLFRSRYSSTVPAIALTAYATGADVERARRAGYQRHIAKPTDYGQLVDAVTETIAGLSAIGKVNRNSAS